MDVRAFWHDVLTKKPESLAVLVLCGRRHSLVVLE